MLEACFIVTYTRVVLDQSSKKPLEAGLYELVLKPDSDVPASKRAELETRLSKDFGSQAKIMDWGKNSLGQLVIRVQVTPKPTAQTGRMTTQALPVVWIAVTAAALIGAALAVLALVKIVEIVKLLPAANDSAGNAALKSGAGLALPVLALLALVLFWPKRRGGAAA